MAKLPPARHCIVAEQIRPEPNNKSTILGFIGFSPDALVFVPIPSVISLALLVVCEEIKSLGDFQLELELIDPTGDLLVKRMPTGQSPTNVVGMKAVCAINFQGLPIRKVGRYDVVLYSEGRFHSRHHFITKALDYKPVFSV